MTAISIEDAQAILADRNVIAVGARGDDERRRRHGARTTFVRVFEVHTDAVPRVAARRCRPRGRDSDRREAAVGGGRDRQRQGGAGACRATFR